MKLQEYTPISRMITGAVCIMSLFLWTASCDVVNIDGEEGKGTINVLLSESGTSGFAAVIESAFVDESNAKPEIGNLEEVNLDIQEMRILYFDNASDSATVDTTDDEFDEGDGEWVTVDITPHKLNLLNISNSDTLLAEAELEDGYYSEIRLILGSDNDVVVDGETHSLKVPSGQQSGYKLKVSEALESGEIVNLTIEFDAEKSVKKTGNGMYMLKPVLKVYNGSDEVDDIEFDDEDEDDDDEEDEEQDDNEEDEEES